MDIRKLLDAAAELDAESAECHKLADDLRDTAKRHSNGSGDVSVMRKFKAKGGRRGKKSLLILALDVLREQGRPTHVADVVAKISEKKGKDISRASVEAALIRALSSDPPKVKRPEKATYAIA
jgi:hypothetical protein